MGNLLDRLKAATGPDRILDRDIARAVTGNATGWWHPCISAWGKGVPHYTKSFEAALMILPPLVYIEVTAGGDSDPQTWPAVSLRWLPPGQADPKKWHGTVHGGPSFALAMCRAAIEVRDRMAAADAR